MTFKDTQLVVESYEHKDALTVSKEERDSGRIDTYSPVSTLSVNISSDDDTPGLLSRIGNAIAPWFMAPPVPLMGSAMPCPYTFMGGDPELGMALWGLGWSPNALDRPQGQQEGPRRLGRDASSGSSSSIERKRWESSRRGP
jgi:hypothetical protein